MLFEYQDAPAVYPHLTSAGMDELTGWGAISGQVMAEDGTIFAVSDSFYGMQPTIFHIDVSETPARIVDAIRVTREGQPAQLMDMEGIALDGEGGFWIASEGRSDRLVPHAIYHVGADGAIEDYIALPMSFWRSSAASALKASPGWATCSTSRCSGNGATIPRTTPRCWATTWRPRNGR
jgi:hypothetical protein